MNGKLVSVKGVGFDETIAAWTNWQGESFKCLDVRFSCLHQRAWYEQVKCNK